MSYYLNGEKAHEVTLFNGEKAEKQPTLASYRKILGWYSNSAMTTTYDFNAPVAENTNIYLKFSTGVYFSAADINTFFFTQSQPLAEGAEHSTVLEGEGSEQYARVSFGELTGPIGSAQLRKENMGLDMSGGTSNVITIKYKNLGKADVLRIYYVVIHKRESGNVPSNAGAHSLRANVSIQSNMSEYDDWATVTVDMAKLSEAVLSAVVTANVTYTVSDGQGGTITKLRGLTTAIANGISGTVGDDAAEDGYSKWGDADILSHFRIDARWDSGSPATQGSNFAGNTILFKEIIFGASKS